MITNTLVKCLDKTAEISIPFTLVLHITLRMQSLKNIVFWRIVILENYRISLGHGTRERSFEIE